MDWAGRRALDKAMDTGRSAEDMDRELAVGPGTAGGIGLQFILFYRVSSTRTVNDYDKMRASLRWIEKMVVFEVEWKPEGVMGQGQPETSGCG